MTVLAAIWTNRKPIEGTGNNPQTTLKIGLSEHLSHSSSWREPYFRITPFYKASKEYKQMRELMEEYFIKNFSQIRHSSFNKKRSLYKVKTYTIATLIVTVMICEHLLKYLFSLYIYRYIIYIYMK